MPIQPTMLWEAVEAQQALAERFQFGSVEQATTWLIATVAQHYGIHVESVDRLTISSYNLLAWLTSVEGPLLAKCCAFVTAHERLLASAELIIWLAQADLPVSAPLLALSGAAQIVSEHLSVGVQRVIPGSLLDPGQLEQAQAAGITLATLHAALASYPRAAELDPQPQIQPLAQLSADWATRKLAETRDPALLTAITPLSQAAETSAGLELSSQLVHNDYRAANILWDSGRIAAVLDFEELSLGYRVNDLAWAAVHLGTYFHDWGPVSAAVQQTFLASYQAQSPLTESEQTWLPRLLLWHSINLASSAAGGPNAAACVDAVGLALNLVETASRSPAREE